MASLSIAEIVDKLQKATTKLERVEILKENDCAALRGILRMNYDQSLVLSLPSGEPPYTKNTNPIGFGLTTLKTSSKGWYVFSEQLAPNLRQSKRESLFISLLEELDSREAEILIAAKDKKLDVGLTKKVIDEAFPGLIRSETTVNVDKEKPKKSKQKASPTGDGQSL